MKVELLTDTRIKHKAGDIVEVSPDSCQFLVSIGAAKPVEEKKAKPKKKAESEPQKTEEA